MNNKRFIKYSRRYRLAIACFIIAIAVIAAVAAIAMTVFASPALELSSVAVTSTLFFVPTVAGAALMMGLFYWFSAENRRTSFFIDEEPQQF